MTYTLSVGFNFFIELLQRKMTDEKLESPLDTPRTMTKEEEEEWEMMVRQRRYV